MSNCWQFALWTIKLFSVSKNNYLLSLWCVPRGVRAREAVRLLACLVLWTIIKFKKKSYLLSVGCVRRDVRTSNREAVRLPALISAETSSSSYILTRSHPFLGSVWLGLACISATNLILYPPKPPRPRTSSHVLILYFILKRKLSKTCWGIECLIEFSSA